MAPPAPPIARHTAHDGPAHQTDLEDHWRHRPELPTTAHALPSPSSAVRKQRNSLLLRLRYSLQQLREQRSPRPPPSDRCLATTTSSPWTSPWTAGDPCSSSSSTSLQADLLHSSPALASHLSTSLPTSVASAMSGSGSRGMWAPGHDRARSPTPSPSRRLSSQSLHLDIEGLDLGGSQSSHFSQQTKVSHGSPALASEGMLSTPRSQRGWKVGAPQMVRGGRPPESGSGSAKGGAHLPVDVDLALMHSVAGAASSPLTSAKSKTNAASQGATGGRATAKLVDSFAAHINENCLDETKFLSIDTSIQFSTRARERAGSRGDIHAAPSKHVLGAFASLGNWSDEEARSQGSTRVAPSPTPDDAILSGSTHGQEGCLSDTENGWGSSSAWGTFASRHEDPSQMLDLLSIEELGMHSVDVGTNDDWEGSMLSAPGRGAQWAVARSMKRQRKWVVAPGLALVGGSTSADSARCVIVSDHFSALTQRNEFQNGPSAFSGSANYELRFLRAGKDVVHQTFQLASPALHRSLAVKGSFSSSAGTVRQIPDSPAWRPPVIDVDSTDVTEEMMASPPLSPVDLASGTRTLARSSGTDESSIGPITPRDLAGREMASPFVFGRYSLGEAEPVKATALPPKAQQDRCPSPRGSMHPLSPQMLGSPNLGASLRGSRGPSKPRDARASGKIERRLSDWFRKKTVPASASSSAIVDLSPSQPIDGAERFLVPLTRSHSRPYRKSPGPASGLILAPSEREMKLRSPPSVGNLSPVGSSSSSSIRSFKPRGPLDSSDASLMTAFLHSPRAQRRRSSSDDQIIMAAGIQRKEQERTSALPLSRLDTYGARSRHSSTGDASAIAKATGLHDPSSSSRLEAIVGSPTTPSSRLELLGLDKVPPHALTMILPLPLFGSGNHRPSRAVRISFVPFALEFPQGSPEMSSSDSKGNVSPGSERSGTTSNDGAAATMSEASHSPASGSGTWYRRLAGAFRDGTDDDKEAAASSATLVDFPARPATKEPVHVSHRRGSTVEAFRVTAQVLRLDESAQRGRIEEDGLPEPTSFPVVLGMCSADRNLEFLADGWAALGLEDGPLRLPCTTEGKRSYGPLAGLADLVFAGCAAVMDL